MTNRNKLLPGLLVLSMLIACGTIVTSACGAAFPSDFVTPMTLDNPAALTGGFASEYHIAISAGIPAVANPEEGPWATSDVITDQELIDLVRSLNYPGIAKSVRVVTDQSDAGNTLDIQASSENGVLITRSPFTTRIHIKLLRESTARNSADPLIGFNPVNKSYELPPEILSPFNPYSIGKQTGLIIPDLIEGLNTRTGAYNLPAPGWTSSGFSLPSSQVGPFMPLTDSIAPLSAISSPLSPFNPSVGPGGYAGTVFGSGPGSAIAFQESQSATGVINSFSYQTD